MEQDSAGGGSGEAREKLGEAFRWVMESTADAPMAAADWLARDIDPACGGAVDLLASPSTSLDRLGKAKDVFKTMRVLGETRADRLVGGRLYAAAIAAGLVNHGRRISRQSDAATIRALQALVDDQEMPKSLRVLAGTALCLIDRTGAGRRAASGATSREPVRPDPASPGEGKLEIERKYLLSGVPPMPPGAEVLAIEQGYVTDAGPGGGRVRKITGADGSISFVHTVKRGVGMVRHETERELDRAEFDSLWPRTEGGRLRKTRHRVPEGDRTWEIDVFDDRDLVLAEVELPSPDAPAPPPAWLSGLIVREVTHEPAFRNAALARSG